MPIPKPDIDASEFDELIKESTDLTLQYGPPWEDHNLSDRGSSRITWISIRLLGIGIGLWIFMERYYIPVSL